MKIALFPSAFHPSLGGVEELSRQLAHALVRRGHEVVLLTQRWPRDLPTFEEFEGLPLHRLAFRSPARSRKSQVSFALSNRLVKRDTQRILRTFGAQIVHVQCIASQAFYARHAAQSLGLPLVVSSQGERTMDATRAFERDPFLRATLRQSLRDAAIVTACSRDTLEDLERWRGEEFGARGHVVYNGIRVEDFEVEPHRHLIDGRERPYVFALGRMVPQKGFDVLLRAFAGARVGGADLILAGEGTEKANLQQLARELKIAGRVHFVGRANRAEVAAWLRGAEFFVLPSRHEPLGIVNLEAMASECPVLATRVGGVPEIVPDGEVGFLVPPDDPAALVEGMEILAADNVLRLKLGRAGRAHARAFDWDALATHYEALYEQALERNSR